VGPFVKVIIMFSALTKSAAKTTEESAKADLASKAQDAAESVERAARGAYDKASDFADDATTNVRALAGHARTNLNSVRDRARSEVQANPLGAAIAVLGVGLLLGFVLRGSQRA
jgi:chemotaxis response regulator CheB